MIWVDNELYLENSNNKNIITKINVINLYNVT